MAGVDACHDMKQFSRQNGYEFKSHQEIYDFRCLLTKVVCRFD